MGILLGLCSGNVCINIDSVNMIEIAAMGGEGFLTAHWAISEERPMCGEKIPFLPKNPYGQRSSPANSGDDGAAGRAGICASDPAAAQADGDGL